MNYLYLTRRNLLTLLSKLDRVKAGGESGCTIIKYDNVHKDYPSSCAPVAVSAIEDEDYYTDRVAGDVHPYDEPDQSKH